MKISFSKLKNEKMLTILKVAFARRPFSNPQWKYGLGVNVLGLAFCIYVGRVG